VAGKRKVFEQALREGHNFAWDGRWKEAIAAYQRALQEFPDNADVHIYLAQAYLSSGEPASALAAYQRACELRPDDPLPHLRAGAILADTGDSAGAVRHYLAAADIFAAMKNWSRAVETLEQAVKLAPEDLTAHERLAGAYLQAGRTQDAVRTYLVLAHLFQRRNERERALECIQQALNINPRSAAARQALEALGQGAAPPAAGPVRPTVEASTAPQEEKAGEEAESANPAEALRRRALETLAEAIFESVEEGAGPSTRALPLLAQAMDHQSRGALEQAVSLFEQALGQGLDWPAVHFNLAVLLQQLGRWEQAVPHFQRAMADPDYAAGAHFALGQGYQARGQTQPALTHFLEALKLLELRAAAEEMHAQLAGCYEALQAQYAGERSAEGALVLISSIVDLLGSPGWEQKAREARRRLDRFAAQGFVTSLVEALATPDAQSALEALAFSEEYMRRRWFASAEEECYRALARVPGYLPLHLRLAEISALQGRTDAALQKCVMVAQTYRLRRQNAQAVQVYRLALQFAPLDTALRKQLIEELLVLGQVDQALEEYIQLADAHYHLAAIDECITAYQEALKLTPRSSERTAWEARLLPRLADLYVQSFDWTRAREIYRRLSALPAPQNLETSLGRIDLAFKLEEIDAGLRELDDLLERLHKEGADEQAERALRSLVDAWPAIAPLQERMADWYIAQGRTEEAIHVLNTLGELQLDAGMTDDAVRTVRKLAALEPDKAGDYQRLLDYLLSARSAQAGTDEPGQA